MLPTDPSSPTLFDLPVVAPRMEPRDDVVYEDADQHPRAGVYLADGAAELRDSAVDES